jgi:hypothetical protein
MLVSGNGGMEEAEMKRQKFPPRLTLDQAEQVAFSAFRLHPETRAWLERHPQEMAASASCGLVEEAWWEVRLLYAEPFPPDRPPSTIYPGCPGDKPCLEIAVCRVHAQSGAFEVHIMEPAAELGVAPDSRRQSDSSGA